MTRWEARLQHLANILAGLSGLLYAWFRYFAGGGGFSSIHPLEPWMHDGHVLLAPILLFAVGLIWRTHVLAKLKSSDSPRRATGILLTFIFVPMAVTAYMIQVSVDERMRRVWVWIHVGTSILWISGYLVHLLTPSRRPSRSQA